MILHTELGLIKKIIYLMMTMFKDIEAKYETHLLKFFNLFNRSRCENTKFSSVNTCEYNYCL